MRHTLPLTAWDRSQSNLHMHVYQAAMPTFPCKAIDVTGGCLLIAAAMLVAILGDKELCK